MTRPPDNWDRYYTDTGHTGYTDQALYRYDQPLRMRAFGLFLSALGPKATPGQRALDIGCGTGDVIGLLRDRNFKVDGIDISGAVAESAAKRFAGDPEVSVSQGTADSLTFGPGTFDLITSVTVLQHIVDPEELAKTLSLTQQMLTSGGVFAVLEIAPLTGVEHDSGPVSVMERTDSEWQDLFVGSGWQVERVKTYTPWGPTVAQWVDRLARYVSRSSLPSPVSPQSDADDSRIIDGEHTEVGMLRRLMRSTRSKARNTALYSMWPLDHIIRLPAPGRLAYYRMYALRKK